MGEREILEAGGTRYVANPNSSWLLVGESIGHSRSVQVSVTDFSSQVGKGPNNR